MIFLTLFSMKSKKWKKIRILKSRWSARINSANQTFTTIENCQPVFPSTIEMKLQIGHIGTKQLAGCCQSDSFLDLKTSRSKILLFFSTKSWATQNGSSMSMKLNVSYFPYCSSLSSSSKSISLPYMNLLIEPTFNFPHWVSWQWRFSWWRYWMTT